MSKRKTESFGNAGSILSHEASLQVMPCGLRRDGVVKTEKVKPLAVEHSIIQAVIGRRLRRHSLRPAGHE